MITEQDLSGYHRFCLEPPYHLDYVSQDLCSILGYTALEIRTLFDNKYSPMVYQKDRPRFLHLIDDLATKEQTLTLHYRMICKDGHMVYISDTITSRRLDDGRLYGFAVAADITKNQLSSYYYPEPVKLIGAYGFLQCTSEKYPKVTHVNDQMMKYLGVTKENSDWMDFLKENIFFMLPFEERDRFRDFLEQAKSSDEPIPIEHQLLRSNGSRITLTGWLSNSVNEYGDKEFSFLYIRKKQSAITGQSLRENSYFRALENAYQAIFEISLERDTVDCIHGRETTDMGSLYDVHMSIESTANFWLNNFIVEEDRALMRHFFKQICASSDDSANSHILQAEFRIRWHNHVIHRFIGVAIHLDASTVLLCCRDTTNIKYTPLKSKESIALDKMRKWVDAIFPKDQSALGVAFIEEVNQKYSIVSVSSNIYAFLGLSQEDYLRYIAEELPWNRIFDSAGFTENYFVSLLKEGTLNITLPDKRSGQSRDFFLTCTSYNQDGQTLYEILVYDRATQGETAIPGNRIFAKTFGHFDLFVNGRPVVFSGPKEKELMALLIDRNGGTLSSNEAISYLWEDEESSDRVSARYRKLAMCLKNTLVKYGIDHILINNHGIRSVDVNAFQCDYYELLKGNEKYKNSFHNVYMADYSWAEDTLATLWDYS
jgi:PAS domain S-box-containing protein